MHSHAATMKEMQNRAIKQHTKTIARNRDAAKRKDAAKSLGQIPLPASVPPLIEALSDKAESVRAAAANSLWKISEQADPARSALRQALNDSSPTVQIRASWALQNIGVDRSELIPTWQQVLQKGTRDSDRFWAAYGLIGTEEPIVLIQPVLDYAKKYADSDIGETALMKLAKTKDRQIIEPMTKTLSTFHPGNSPILKTLKTYDPKPDDWLNLVLSQLAFNNNRLSLDALGIIRNQPLKEEEIAVWLPKVTPLIHGSDIGVRSMSIALLGMAGGHAKDSTFKLARIMMTDGNADIRRAAAGAIGEIGDRRSTFSEDTKQAIAKDAQTALIQVIENDKDRSTRVAAIRSLGKLQIDLAQTQPMLVRVAIRGNDINVQSTALQALSLSGSAPEEIINQLTTFKNTANPRLARQVESTIKSMQSGRTTSPTLTANAQDKTNQKQALTNLRSMDAAFDEMAFFRALAMADETKIKGYLDAGVSPDYRFTSMNNRTALYALVESMRACNAKVRPTPEKTKNLVRFFLEKGCNPNLTDNMGNTPLMSAASKCDAELIQILLDAGADPQIKSKAGLTALEFSFMYANDGADALIKAGSRLPADKVESYKAAYGSNPAALDLIKRATK